MSKENPSLLLVKISSKNLNMTRMNPKNEKLVEQ
jgi:hypothetical protein